MAEKILLIVVDGLRPDAVAACGNDEFLSFFKNGFYTFNAQTVYPPITLPCHISLFQSCDPERHRVQSNIYVPSNHAIPGIVEVLAGRGLQSAFFYGWEELKDLCTPGYHLSYSWFMSAHAYPKMNVDRRETEACKTHIQEFAPDFAFMHLEETDETGHKYGWMSPEYLACVHRAADCILDLSKAIPEDYSIIVTADHGGHSRSHGDAIPEDMTIPMAFHGKRFRPARKLANASIIDIAPTITDLLCIPPAADWDGKSVLQQC